MPVYTFKTTHSSGERRSGQVAADSKDEAEAILLAQEEGHVEFIIDPSEVKDLEQKLKEGTLSGRDKARLFSHRQDKPYKVEAVKGAES